MLHLRAWLEMIASGSLLRRDAQLMLTNQPRQALVGDGDIVLRCKFLLNPDDIALTVTEELANLSDVLIISRVFAYRWSACRRFEHPVHCVAGNLQLLGDHPLRYPLFGHFPDHLFFDRVDHLQGAP